MDEKLIVVAKDDITKDHIKELDDLGQTFKKAIEHFYSHYKDWKKDWHGVDGKLNGWGKAKDARDVIKASIKRAK